ncbi:MAG: AMIN domain-containing protein [Coleofasciculaceae cyanobacterium SM2_3_26]|nr:AMIN domain-containing protein [Coleofasciculaceae cyanobacterium SM2_3_26]
MPEAERNTSAALMPGVVSRSSVSALMGISPGMSQQIAQAVSVQVTGIRLNPTARGLEVVLETQSGTQPEVYLVNQGNDAIADLTNALLALPGGNAFHQTQPFVGIESVTVAPLPGGGVRVIVRGGGSAPTGQVVSEDPRGIVLSYAPTSLGNTSASRETAIPGNAATDPGQFPRDFPDPNGLRDVLVPEPDIFVDGVPVQGQQARPAPIQPRAIAPPVGDIAVSSSEITAPGLDLGTDALVPFLVLRDAPVRDVLGLLARSANLDFVFTDGETPGAVPGASPTNNNLQLIITLDVRNKPVQEVFENVLRISGLEATRRGSTIFVAPRLNNAARNTTVRSLRLNQVTVDGALDFLAGMGAEVSVSEEQEVTTVTAVGLGDQNAATPANRISTTTQRQLSVRRVDYQTPFPPCAISSLSATSAPTPSP